MKKYKFKFSPVLITLVSLLIVISVLGTGINLYRFFNPLLKSFRTVRPIIFFALSVVLFVLAVLTILRSRYEFKGGELYFIVGVIKFKLGLNQVVLVKEYQNKNLVLCFSDAKFTVVFIQVSEFDSFIKTLRELNPKVLFESSEK